MRRIFQCNLLAKPGVTQDQWVSRIARNPVLNLAAGAPHLSAQQPRLVGRMNARNRPEVRSAEDVYGHLFTAIVDQRLLPGTKLTEFALVETFGVGRRVVGAALQRLAWEGLLVAFANRGTFVAAPDADEVREIFAARIAIEGGTTEAVARAADPAAIARLSDNLAQERRLREEGRIREAIHLSGGFHRLMAELSGNRILAQQVRLLVARTSLVLNLFENRDGLSGWHDHHDDLVNLCREGKVEPAVALMREHIRELEGSLALDRRRPVSFDMVGVFAIEPS
ncbi:GntR family transcriptional regulator [Bosea thiooxidans]|nr:GntR family transcriptional regulator [Bosea sp. (in: a-proteobacteria)]